MNQLIATFAGLTTLFQQAIHRSNRTVIFPFIEQRRINSGWRAILEAFFVQARQHHLSFHLVECACRRRPRRGYHRRRNPTAIPVVRSARHTQTFAAEQSAQAASRRRSRFGFCKDALFIFSGVGPPLWFGNYFWVRPCTSDRIGARFGCRCTALRLASLAFAPFRVSQTPRRKNNTKRIHTCPFLSRPAH